jgi:hypothetical protein
MNDSLPAITISVPVNGGCFDYCLVAVDMLSCANIFTIRQTYRQVKHSSQLSSRIGDEEGEVMCA